MAPYIFGLRNKIHVVDIRQTIRGLLLAKIHDDPARITEMSRVALSALRGCPLKTQN